MSNLSEHHSSAQSSADEPVTTGDIINKPARPRLVPMERDDTTSIEIDLLSKDEVEQLRSRWMTIQSHFVDEPRKCVEDADQLVASAIKRVAEVFYEKREELERQW